MKLVYLPALAGGWASGFLMTSRWTGYPIMPFDLQLQGTSAWHPYLLTSFWYWRRQRFRWEPEHFVFGDSGGYQVLTSSAQIDPEEALRWQLRYCRVGVLLDSPPVKRWQEWDGCLARTVTATQAALPIYLAARETGTPFRWWGVVHGRTIDELAQWYRAISKVYPFTDEGEGWAFRPHPLNDPEAMRQVLGFIQQQGIRRAHFFATSGVNAIDTLCFYGPRVGLEWASFDSTSPIHQGAMRRLNVNGKAVRVTPPELARYMLEVCRCVSCDLLRAEVREQPDLRHEEFHLKDRLIFHNILEWLARYETLRQRYAPEGAGGS